MRAELYRPDAPDAVVATAIWSGGRPELVVVDPSVEGLDRLLRPVPVVIDDPALRALGTLGEVLLQPGSLPWFRAALAERGTELGLAVRFVAEDVRGGWDPAAQYRTFDEQAERLAGA